MRSKTLIIAALFSICMLSACGSTGTTASMNETDSRREVSLTDEENMDLYNELTYLIEGVGTASSLDWINNDVYISDSDLIEALGTKNIKYYVAKNAAYIQVDNYMYRFQFDNNNKVESYIKYTLEA